MKVNARLDSEAQSVEGYPYWGGSLGFHTSLGIELSDLHRAAEDLLERAIADVGSETDGIEIERQVVQGPAAEVLVHTASARDLLVVGARGHGGFTGLSTAASRERAAAAQTESPTTA